MRDYLVDNIALIHPKCVFFTRRHVACRLVDAQLAAGSVEANSSCYERSRHLQWAGVVGLSTSRKAVMVASLLSIFHIPSIGTLSSSDELSDKTRSDGSLMDKSIPQELKAFERFGLRNRFGFLSSLSSTRENIRCYE